jgi:hypothetical protein
MSDKPTADPQSGKAGGPKRKLMKAAHEKPNYGGKIKETSPGILKKPIPAEGKECAYVKSHTRQENKFNRRGATRVWNKVRPHIPANVAGHDPKDPGEYTYPTSVKPPECAASYNGHKVAGR